MFQTELGAGRIERTRRPHRPTATKVKKVNLISTSYRVGLAEGSPSDHPDQNHSGPFWKLESLGYYIITTVITTFIAQGATFQRVVSGKTYM